MANATECLKPIGSEFAGVLKPLALGDLYGVMLVYAGGVVLGTIVFLIEYANGAYLRRYHTE
ncbi:hypothetical protein SK128_004794 [Halocaridina rubra]|uniref:Uncharacterized protein n=1 Tax=Halocaridina rubra TaxID=373956 RepID=A0AAN8WJQ2_HALRR